MPVSSAVAASPEPKYNVRDLKRRAARWLCADLQKDLAACTVTNHGERNRRADTERDMKTTSTRKNRRRDHQHHVERDRRVDTSHDSNARGEHRYADAHQTEAEQKARRDRDDLKRALASQRPVSPRQQR
jgi:hypothetical protein